MPLRVGDIRSELVHQDVGVDGVVVTLHLGAKHIAVRLPADCVVDMPDRSVTPAVASQVGAATGESRRQE